MTVQATDNGPVAAQATAKHEHCERCATRYTRVRELEQSIREIQLDAQRRCADLTDKANELRSRIDEHWRSGAHRPRYTVLVARDAKLDSRGHAPSTACLAIASACCVCKVRLTFESMGKRIEVIYGATQRDACEVRELHA